MMPRRKTCHFCESKVTIDYKDEHQLDRFPNDRGKICRGACRAPAGHQRQLSQAIKRDGSGTHPHPDHQR